MKFNIGLIPLPGMGLYMHNEHLVFTKEHLVLTIPVGQVAGLKEETDTLRYGSDLYMYMYKTSELTLV